MAAPLPAPRGVGFLVASAIVGAWGVLNVLAQAWLCTGLFITAHDAMHGTVSRARWLNHAVGAVACHLLAGQRRPPAHGLSVMCALGMVH